MYVSVKLKMESGKLIMKKGLILLAILGLSISVFAFEYKPKNVDKNPFEKNVQENKKTETAVQPEMREIKTLAEYFKYLPAEVNRHWTPQKANQDYEVTVQFVIHRDGSISDVQIVGTNYPNANAAVLNAVKMGAPYQPLPRSYPKDEVKAQVVLEYHK